MTSSQLDELTFGRLFDGDGVRRPFSWFKELDILPETTTMVGSSLNESPQLLASTPSASISTLESPDKVSDEAADTIPTSSLKASGIFIDRQTTLPQDLQELLKRILQLEQAENEAASAHRIVNISKRLTHLSKADGIRAIRRDLLGSDALDLFNSDLSELLRHKLAVGITATDNTEWNTGSLPNPPHKTVPSGESAIMKDLESDTVYGFLTPEAAQDLNTISLFTEEESYTAQRYQTCDEVLFPFLTAEWASFAKGEGRRAAEQRASLVGATNVHALIQLSEKAGVHPTTSKTAHFSITCDLEVVALHVHWQRVSADGKLFYEMTTLLKTFLNDEAGVTKIVSAVKNITKMAKEDRIRMIKDALNAPQVASQNGTKSMDTAPAAAPAIASSPVAAPAVASFPAAKPSVASATTSHPTIAALSNAAPKTIPTHDRQISEIIGSYTEREILHTPTSKLITRIDPAFSASPAPEQTVELPSSPSPATKNTESKTDTEIEIDHSRYSDESSNLNHVFVFNNKNETKTEERNATLTSTTKNTELKDAIPFGETEIEIKLDGQDADLISGLETTEQKDAISFDKTENTTTSQDEGAALPATIETPDQKNDSPCDNTEIESNFPDSDASSSVHPVEQKNEAPAKINFSRYEDPNGNLSHVFPWMSNKQDDAESQTSDQSSTNTYHSIDAEVSQCDEECATSDDEVTTFDFATVARKTSFEFRAESPPADGPSGSEKSATNALSIAFHQSLQTEKRTKPVVEIFDSEDSDLEDDDQHKKTRSGSSSSTKSINTKTVNFRMIEEDVEKEPEAQIEKETEVEVEVESEPEVKVGKKHRKNRKNKKSGSSNAGSSNVLEHPADPESVRTWKKIKDLNKKKVKKTGNAVKTGKKKH